MSTQKLTSSEYKKLASEANERAIESFDRCDTDGFLSQWALAIQEREYNALAHLAENNWKSSFQTLVTAKGELVPCRKIETKYGTSYGVYQSFVDAEKGGEIIQWVGLGKRAAKNKGYKIAWVISEANVKMSDGYASQAFFVPANRVFTPENCQIIEVIE